MAKVTDTLGREIAVNYSEDLYPVSITQTWKSNNGSGTNTTHTWATFGYTYITLNPAWDSSITNTGPQAGTVLKVLDKVIYPDASSTKFAYNAFGQVAKIENIAADSPTHVLNRVRTNLESPGTNLTDVPRLGESRLFVENFNGGNETVVTNTIASGHQVTDIDGGTVAASLIQVAMQNHPTGNVTNTYVGESGWREGLPVRVDDYAAGNGLELKRSSWTKWTQDDVNFVDVQNPRVVESKVGDGVNLKRSTMEYLLYPSTNISKFGLVSAVNVYDSDQSTVLKRAETDYNFATVYMNRRIIGVPAETRVYGYENSQLALVSRMTYGFDEGNFAQESNQIISPVGHDATNFGSNLIIGRGNLTSTTRHDVTGQTATVTSRVIYDIAGSVVAQLDPLNRKVLIDYTDAFNDSQNRNAFAYPTKVYDPAGNYSEVKYRFDIGANVRAQSPAPAGNSQGKITERIYDSIGRLLKDTLTNNGAYTRYEYPANGIQSKTFSTVVDNDNDGADADDEVLSESWSDGAGRVRLSRVPHTFSGGSTATWAGTVSEYDVLGRVKRQSVPTEVDANFQPAGDDATRGFLWTYQKYDWMSRVVRKINTDGVDSPTLNDSDVLISYAGCGCAGGLVVTVEGELVPRDDQPSLSARRKQKVYDDILGRSYKTESYNWDGTTVYSTAVSSFNGRDQVTLSRQFAGDTNSTTFQDTTATYDGHGRVLQTHSPEQDANKFSSYNYNLDGSIASKTDARGAVTTYTYNNLGLVEQIDSTMPEGGNLTPEPPSPTPTPDPTGNQPIGWLDEVSSDSNGQTWIANGWSLDPDTPNTAISVHFYIDGPAGQGTFIGETVANLPRPDVNTSTGYPGDHGFEFTIPSQYLDGNQHQLYAYGINTGTGDNPQLQGSPKTFAPSSPAVIPPLDRSVTFTYDVLGNRTSMTDELGDMQYEYNEMGQITAETRRFNDTMPNAPMSGNRFKLQYEYAMGGRLKSYIDPFGQEISYDRDERGRLSSVTGSSFGGVTTYADDAEYTAWGGLKKADYSGDVQLEMSYNNSLSASSMSLQKADNSFLVNKNYNYYADGKLSYLQDEVDARFDRLNTYDNAGRIKEGKSGLEARGGVVAPVDQETNLPYRQSYAFNAYSNMTQVNNLHWGTSSWSGQNFNQSFTYVNNRIQKPDWLFDEDGRNTKSVADDAEATFKMFDAAGQLVRTLTDHADSVSFYSGQGDEIKRHVRTLNEQTGAWAATPTKYYIRSSVLKGRVVSEVWGSGKKHRSYVKGIGSQTAVQTAYYTETSPLHESVIFQYADPMGVSYRTTDRNGAAVAAGDGGEGSPIETDPLGGSVVTSSPYFQPPVYTPEPQYPELQPYSPPDLFTPDFSSLYSFFGSRVADLPGFGTNWGSFAELGMLQYEERVWNAFLGFGFNTNEQLGGIPGTRLTPTYGLLNPDDDYEGESPDEGEIVTVDTEWDIIGYEWAFDDDWRNNSLNIWNGNLLDLSKVAYTDAIVEKTVVVTGKGGEVEHPSTINAIKDQIRRLVTDPVCRKAMIDAGFGDPRELLINSIENMTSGSSNSFTYRIMSAFALRDGDVAGQTPFSPDDVQRLLNSRAPATTVPEAGITVVRNTIYSGRGLAHNIVHEYLHGIGYPGKYYVGSAEALAGFHDLHYLGDKYESVMRACTQ